jgi:hypothetical protein
MMQEGFELRAAAAYAPPFFTILQLSRELRQSSFCLFVFSIRMTPMLNYENGPPTTAAVVGLAITK